MLHQLGWRSLEQRRADIRLIFHKSFHLLGAVDLSKDLTPKTYVSRHSHLYDTFHQRRKTILLIASSQEQSTSGIASQVSVVITPSLDIFKDGVAKLKH